MLKIADETCTNCGATIGRLETPCVWKEKIVCQGCHTRLSPVPIDYASPAPLPLPALADAPNGPPIICPNPNCGYRGPSFCTRKGSVALGIALLLLWILPGILYLCLCCDGVTLTCPRCGVTVR